MQSGLTGITSVSTSPCSSGAAGATQHWYDPVIAVVNTIVRRLQTVEWATGYRSQFSRDLKGKKAQSKFHSPYTQAAAQLINAGHQLSESAVSGYLQKPQANRGISSLSNNELDRLKNMGITDLETPTELRPYAVIDRFMTTAISHQLAGSHNQVDLVKSDLTTSYEPAIRHLGNKEAQSLLFFPVVLESRNPLIESRHIVWVTVDRKRKEIEYYDPKGLSIEGTAAESVLEGVRESLEIPDYPLVQNHYRHQLDTHNCGAFGIAYAQARIQGHSFRGFTRNWNQNIEVVRREMADHMKAEAAKYTPSATQQRVVALESTDEDQISDDEFVEIL